MGQVFGGVRSEVQEAVIQGNWETVKDYARDGFRREELAALALAYSSKRQWFEREQFRVILELCKTNLIESTFTELVEKGLWRSVGAFLERGVHEDFRRWAVTRALKGAEDIDLPDILARCTDAQFDEVFSFAVDRHIWGAVGALLKREKDVLTWTGWRSESVASGVQRQKAFQEATKSQHIQDQDLASILCSCAAHQTALRDTCLKTAVVRGLWVAVKEILELRLKTSMLANNSILRKITGALGCSPRVQMSWLSNLDRWALKEVVQRADEQVLIKHFLPFCGHDMVETVLRDLASRKLWRAASTLLVQNKDEEDSSAAEPVRQNVSGGSPVISQNDAHEQNGNGDVPEVSKNNTHAQNVIGGGPQLGHNHTPTQNVNGSAPNVIHNNGDQTVSQNNANALFPQTSGPLPLPFCSNTGPRPVNVFRNDDDRFAFILVESVRRGIWGVVREMQKHGFSDSHLLWVTGEATKVAGIMGCCLDNSRHGSKDQLQSLLAMLDTIRPWVAP